MRLLKQYYFEVVIALSGSYHLPLCHALLSLWSTPSPRRMIYLLNGPVPISVLTRRISSQKLLSELKSKMFNHYITNYQQNRTINMKS